MRAKLNEAQNKFLIYTTGNSSEKLHQTYVEKNLHQLWKTTNGRYFLRILFPDGEGGWTEHEIRAMTIQEAARWLLSSLGESALAYDLINQNQFPNEYA